MKTEQKENKQIVDCFGLTSEEKEKAMKDNYNPTLDLGALDIGESVSIEFLDDEPRQIEITNDKDEQEDKRIINVLDLDTGCKYTLWLSAKSLCMSLAKIFEEHDKKLSGVRARITIGEYKHKEYGKTRAYRVQEIVSSDIVDRK